MYSFKAGRFSCMWRPCIRHGFLRKLLLSGSGCARLAGHRQAKRHWCHSGSFPESMPITLRLLNVSHSLLWLSPLRSQARGGTGRLAPSRWIEQVSLSQHVLLTAPIKDSGFCRLAICSVALALLVGVQVSWDSATQRVQRERAGFQSGTSR